MGFFDFKRIYGGNMNKILKELYKSFKKLLYTIKHRNRFIANKETIRRRLDVCFGTKTSGNRDMCDELLVNSTFLFWKKARCGVCGCYVKAKAKLDFEDCPLKKWH